LDPAALATNSQALYVFWPVWRREGGTRYNYPGPPPPPPPLPKKPALRLYLLIEEKEEKEKKKNLASGA